MEQSEETKERMKEYNREWHLKNKEKVKERKRLYNIKNKEKVKDRERIYFQKNKEKINERRKKHRLKNKDKINKRNREKYKENKQQLKYYLENRERIREVQRQYRLKNKEKIKELEKRNCLKYKEKKKKYIKERLQTDKEFKIAINLRNRIRGAVTNQNSKKSFKFVELLGCTVIEAREHIEKQFKDGMTWENYGVFGWHIDHIVPCCYFDLQDPEQQKKCFHYTNLQPLWAYENLSKNGKIPDNLKEEKSQ